VGRSLIGDDGCFLFERESGGERSICIRRRGGEEEEKGRRRGVKEVTCDG
jgi:hypothetical protein